MEKELHDVPLYREFVGLDVRAEVKVTHLGHDGS